MKAEVLNQIAKQFVDLYIDEVDEIDEIDSDMISEWWGMTCDQYGYSQENKSEVLDEIENEVYKIINKK